MKKIFLMVAFMATICSAEAWTGVVERASYILARKHMTKEAAAEYSRILKLRQTVDYKWVADKSAKASLDASLHSTTTCEKDIVVRIEKAIEVLKNRENHTGREQLEALETLRRLMVELHTISRIAIEGVEHSQNDFSFTWSSNREGPSPEKRDKYENRGTLTWYKLWGSHICLWHQGWSPEYYAYDLDIRFGRLRDEAMKGSLRDWAHEMGERAKPMYDWAKPDMLLRNESRLRLEDIHLEMVARSAYRLAAVMNSVVK